MPRPKGSKNKPKAAPMAAPVRERLDSGWEDVHGNRAIHLWNRDDTPAIVTGKFLGLVEGNLTNSATGEKSKNFKLGVGEEIQLWAAPAILADRLSTLPPGCMVRIRHIGWIKTRSGQDAMDFQVQVKTDTLPQEKIPF